MIEKIGGRDYRIYQVESIHEDDSYVECLDMEKDEIVCEIRIDENNLAYLLPMNREIDVQVLSRVISFLKDLG